MATCKVPESYLTKLCERYRKARKKDCGKILDELVATTGYHRKHAVPLLRGTRHHRNPRTPLRRLRRRIYLAEDQRAVLWLADLFDQISSKRLRAAMDVELDHVRDDLALSRACFQRLRHVSPSTMDRFRRTERRPVRRRRGGTKPGTLLKCQIPVRTFADWDDKRPGFEEIDLVQHDGGNPSGFFACTLDVTDVSTGWTEMQAVVTQAQKHVFAALADSRGHLPFPLLGLDSDNGAEFTLAPAQTAGAVQHPVANLSRGFLPENRQHAIELGGCPFAHRRVASNFTNWSARLALMARALHPADRGVPRRWSRDRPSPSEVPPRGWPQHPSFDVLKERG